MIAFDSNPDRLPTRLAAAMLASLLALALVGQPAVAQQVVYEGIRGRVLDAEGMPLVGYRVLFQPEDQSATVLGQPASADGEFIVSLIRGRVYTPIALVTPTGERKPLGDQPPLTAVQGARCEVRLAAEPAGEEAPPAPAVAAGEAFEIVGRLHDPEGNPLVDYRVGFRAMNEVQVFVSSPTEVDGSYVVVLPRGDLYVPFVVLSPSGRRQELENEQPIQPVQGGQRDIEARSMAPKNPIPDPQFPGADRLFLSFVEDTRVVRYWRGDFQIELASFEDSDVVLGRAVGAMQIPAIPDVEWGARIGVGDTDSSIPGGDGSGLTDLDLWGKLDLGDRPSGARWTAGFTLTLPTGEAARGLGADATSTKLFAASRRKLSLGVLSYNVGLRFTADGRVGDVRLDGEVSVSGGVGWILPVEERMVLVVESLLESERFDGQGADVRLGAGINWRLMDLFVLRAAAAFGLGDGAPDSQFLVGASFEY